MMVIITHIEMVKRMRKLTRVIEENLERRFIYGKNNDDCRW